MSDDAEAIAFKEARRVAVAAERRRLAALSAQDKMVRNSFVRGGSNFLRRNAASQAAPDRNLSEEATRGRLAKGKLIASPAFASAVVSFLHEQHDSAKRLKRAQARRQAATGRAWQVLRYNVLKASNGRCALCGASAADGAQLEVDHIKPVSLFPELANKASNLQVLCKCCNGGKSNLDDTDWRAA